MSHAAIPFLPLSDTIESKRVFKKLILAHSALAEMKGTAVEIPNKDILVHTLALQEAKSSSEVENIITTNDELFQSDFNAGKFRTLAAKEVYNYADALLRGFTTLKETGYISLNHIIDIQARLVETKAGFRKLPGTALHNEQTGATVYTPPQDYQDILAYMGNLEGFINNDSLSDCDPLVKMAIIHHQFETIHPFYDGNGRTGRIINVLYLVKEGLLDIPILYLSRYINQHKDTYYTLLQKVRTHHAWEEWVLFILDAVEQTSLQTTKIIHGIKALMLAAKETMRAALPKIYSQDLLNNIFKYPYTKIDFIMDDLRISRVTAGKYLNQLSAINIMDKRKLGKENYYINITLYNFLANVNELIKL
jgi:Fic family protein